MVTTSSRAPRQGRLDQIREAWTALGAEDPLWAVCVDRDRRGGRWDIAEFMATGRAEVALVMDRLDQLGICPAKVTALDFGCGVGRLTGALNDFFGAVTGVDIAEPMLARARTLYADRPGCTFLANDLPDLSIFGDGTFDLVYSSLVLQHMPRDLAAGYLREFVRILRPGGAIAIVVPQAHLRTPSGLVYSLAPQPLIGFLQRTFFGYRAAMQMHTLPAWRAARIVESAGARLIASDPRPGVGPHWHFACHFIARPATG